MIAFLTSLFCTESKPKSKGKPPKISYSWSGKVSVSADSVIRSPKFRDQMKKADAFFEAQSPIESK